MFYHSQYRNTSKSLRIVLKPGQRITSFDKRANAVHISNWSWHKGRGHVLTLCYSGTLADSILDYRLMKPTTLQRTRTQAEANAKIVLIEEKFGELPIYSFCKDLDVKAVEKIAAGYKTNEPPPAPVIVGWNRTSRLVGKAVRNVREKTNQS